MNYSDFQDPFELNKLLLYKFHFKYFSFFVEKSAKYFCFPQIDFSNNKFVANISFKFLGKTYSIRKLKLI
jgi:hypothetical protein